MNHLRTPAIFRGQTVSTWGEWNQININGGIPLGSMIHITPREILTQGTIKNRLEKTHSTPPYTMCGNSVVKKKLRIQAQSNWDFVGVANLSGSPRPHLVALTGFPYRLPVVIFVDWGSGKPILVLSFLSALQSHFYVHCLVGNFMECSLLDRIF